MRFPAKKNAATHVAHKHRAISRQENMALATPVGLSWDSPPPPLACEQALVWVLCARCETRVAKPRERGARWAGLGEEIACCYYCKFFIPTPEAIKFHRK